MSGLNANSHSQENLRRSQRKKMKNLQYFTGNTQGKHGWAGYVTSKTCHKYALDEWPLQEVA